MVEFCLYLLIGVISGLLAGLLGIGGGVIIVPALALIFSYVGLPETAVMHIAQSTSLGAIILTTLTAVIIQHRNKAIRWDIFQFLAPGIIGGTFFGAIIAGMLSTQTLKNMFGVFVSLIAIHLFFHKKQKPSTLNLKTAHVLQITSGFCVGAISGMLGIGGGVFIVPLLLRFGLSAHHATATSSLCALLLSIVGTLSYIYIGWNAAGLPEGSTGYVYWVAVLGISVMAVICVPLGAKLAKKLSGETLVRTFSVFLFLVGLGMLFNY